MIKTSGSHVLTPNRKFARKRVRPNAAASPITTPANASRMPSITMALRTWPGAAPSAMRMPNSCVRCWTEYAINPQMPMAASSSAALPKIVSSVMLNRSRAVERVTTSSMVRTRATGKPPLASRSSRSMEARSVCGATRVRTIHAMVEARAARAVMPSVTCAAGTYTIGCGSRLSPKSCTAPTTPTIWRAGSSNSGP